MNHVTYSILFALSIFAGMLVLLEVGRIVGRRRAARDPEAGRAGLGAVEGAVFALLGLLVAFTFSGAASRFDARRELIIQEANAVGTAWLRIDLLPVSEQSEVRELMRQYLDSRIAVYSKVPDMKAVQEELGRANQLQVLIWKRVMSASREAPSPLHSTLILALNEMFDVASSRTLVARIHPPLIIFGMLAALALLSALLAGFAMSESKSRSWVHTLSFAFIMAATVYVILDLEFPRAGLIRVDSFDQALTELRQGMN